MQGRIYRSYTEVMHNVLETTKSNRQGTNIWVVKGNVHTEMKDICVKIMMIT